MAIAESSNELPAVIAASSNELPADIASAAQTLPANVGAERPPEPFHSEFTIRKKGCREISVERNGEVFAFEGHIVEKGQILGTAFTKLEAGQLLRCSSRWM